MLEVRSNCSPRLVLPLADLYPRFLPSQEHVSGKLDPTHFPYLRNAPNEPAPTSSLRGSASSPAPSAAGSLRSQRPNWARAAPSGAPREGTKQRLIIFVAGGITYSEMRTAYQVGLALNKEVIIGESRRLRLETRRLES